MPWETYEFLPSLILSPYEDSSCGERVPSINQLIHLAIYLFALSAARLYSLSPSESRK